MSANGKNMQNDSEDMLNAKRLVPPHEEKG
jgi:hypothetical protein